MEKLRVFQRENLIFEIQMIWSPNGSSLIQNTNEWVARRSERPREGTLFLHFHNLEVNDNGNAANRNDTI